MTAIFAIFVLLIAAAGCFVGANFCQAPAAQQSLAGLGGALVGMILPSVPNALQALVNKPRDTQAGHATPVVFFFGAFAMVAVVFAMAMPSMGCRVSPSAFYQATVDCAKVNPERNATSAAVMTCITGAIAGNAIACISQLPQTLHWTIDEAACVIADIASKQDKKVGAGIATNADLELRNEAVRFLTDNHIRIANTYVGAQ